MNRQSSAASAHQPLLDPARIVRWQYLGRLAVVAAVYLAAVIGWKDAPRESTLVASVMAVATLLFTVASAAWSEIYKRSLATGFRNLQIGFDLVLVTAIVHVTGGADSQFAALYIPVIVAAALLLSLASGVVVALIACALYLGDVILAHRAGLDLALWLQFVVFAVVALSSGYISARLREAGAGHERLAVELVTVRLQAEDILRNIRSGIVTVDRDGVLLFANPTAGALLGLDLERELGRPILDRVATVAPVLAEALRRAVQEGVRTVRAEGAVQRNGRLVPIGLNTTATVLEENGAGFGERQGLVTGTAIFQDISDQKRLDMLHRRTQRLEAVAELSASLAHEIKNPLASIRSAVEQIGRSQRATPDEQTLAELIVRESDRLARLLTEFLDFARARVSRLQQLDLARVVQGAASLAAAHPDRPQDVVVKCLVPATPLLVEGDEDLLHRAFFNLVLNAVQASPAGAVVQVEAEAIGAEELPPGVTLGEAGSGGAVVRVSDCGPGIPAEIRDRIFDPFFTTKAGGSGLGLAIVHRAIESHRGFVFVDSDSAGTRMTVLLPSLQAVTEGQ